MAIKGSAVRKVIVITLNWNGEAWLRPCVESVLRSSYPDFELVVIDNDSTDSSAVRIRQEFPRVKVIQNGANLGYSRGFNVGLEYGFGERNADYCLVMNNDTVIDEDAIAALVECAEADRRAGFVTGKVYYFDQPDTLQTVGKCEDPVRWNGEHIGAREIDVGQHDEVAERVFADDIFTLVRREMYEQTGGYNPVFFLQCEEYDWQARAKTLGWKIVYTPKARLWHKVGMTLGKASPKKAYYDARNPMIVLMLHRSPEFFRRFFRDHVRRSVRTLVRQGAKLHWATSWNIAQGLASGITWGFRNKKLTVQHFLR
jgi:hypothetical protein